MPNTNRGVIPEKHLHHQTNQLSSRFEVDTQQVGGSLVGRGIVNFENNENMRSAGSGIFVLPSHAQERREGNISNPRVLSDMGLAIPIKKVNTIYS
jgi:hypothetical protein